MRQLLLLVSVLLSMIPCGAFAATLEYTINGGAPQSVPPFNDGDPVLIDLSATDLSGDVAVHIYGAGTSGRETSVGMVTIRGRMDSGAQFLMLSVAVADPSELDPFDDPEALRLHGFKNFGGLQFVGPVGDPTNTSLQDHARVSVTVRGNITGDITAGQLYRIDALRNLTSGEGGTISGNLRSTRANYRVVGLANEYSIRYVRAAWELSGTVTADADPGVAFQADDDFWWSSISTVIVGPSTSAGRPHRKRACRLRPHHRCALHREGWCQRHGPFLHHRRRPRRPRERPH